MTTNIKNTTTGELLTELPITPLQTHTRKETTMDTMNNKTATECSCKGKDTCSFGRCGECGICETKEFDLFTQLLKDYTSSKTKPVQLVRTLPDSDGFTQEIVEKTNTLIDKDEYLTVIYGYNHLNPYCSFVVLLPTREMLFWNRFEEEMLVSGLEPKNHDFYKWLKSFDIEALSVYCEDVKELPQGFALLWEDYGLEKAGRYVYREDEMERVLSELENAPKDTKYVYCHIGEYEYPEHIPFILTRTRDLLLPYTDEEDVINLIALGEEEENGFVDVHVGVPSELISLIKERRKCSDRIATERLRFGEFAW